MRKFPEAIAVFERAIQECDSMDARPLLARANYYFAEALMCTSGSTDRERAREACRVAQVTCEETDADGLARRISKLRIELSLCA